MALVLETRVITDATQSQVAFKQLGQEAANAAKPMQEAAKAVEDAGKKTTGFGKSTDELKSKLHGINPAINATRQLLNSMGGEAGKVGAELLGIGKDVTELRSKMAGGGGLVATLGAVGLAVASVVVAFHTVSAAIKEAEDHVLAFGKFQGGKQFDSLKQFLDKAASIRADTQARARGFLNDQDLTFANQIGIAEGQIAINRRILAGNPSKRERNIAQNQLEDAKQTLAELRAAYRVFNKDLLDDQRKRLDAQLDAEKKLVADFLALQQAAADKADAVWKQGYSTFREMEKLRINLIADDDKKAIALATAESDALIVQKSRELAANKITQQDFDRFVSLSAANLAKTKEDIEKAAREKKKAADRAASEESFRYQEELARAREQFDLSQANSARSLASRKAALAQQISATREAPFRTSFESQKAALGLEFDQLQREYGDRSAELRDKIEALDADLVREIGRHGLFSTEAHRLADERAQAQTELDGLKEILDQELGLVSTRRDILSNAGIRQGAARFDAFRSTEGMPGQQAVVALNRDLLENQRELHAIDLQLADAEQGLGTATGEKADALRAYIPLLKEEKQLFQDKVAAEKALLGNKQRSPAQTEQLAATLDKIKQVGGSVEQSLGDAVMAGLTGHNDEIRDIFRNLFTDIASDFTRLALNNLATALMGNSASPSQSGISGLLQLGLSSGLGALGVTTAPAAAPAVPTKSAMVSITNVNVTDDEATTVIKAATKKPGEIVNVLNASRNRLRTTSRVA